MSISRDEILAWLQDVAQTIAENRDYLVQLDSPIGDADHGANMDRGFRAIMGKMGEISDKDIGTIFKTAAMTLIATVGGASGPLYGTFFLQAGTKTTGKMEITIEEWAVVLEAALAGIVMRGKAEVNQKTMVDALTPAVQALKQAVADGKTQAEALELSAEAARQGMLATIPMLALKGRASY
ncbi:MAG TPA: dihydroxyacetone kinase subunit DhaL, partial [Anaerolineales bacterium]|nr:dihydroxyacetone kinase subunit DhaL [Anaerolineales bacterium]